MNMDRWWKDNESGKICPSDVLSTTNSRWHTLGLNLGLHGEKPVTNHPSHGTVIIFNNTNDKNVSNQLTKYKLTVLAGTVMSFCETIS
jgi:hypothetical protein